MMKVPMFDSAEQRDLAPDVPVSSGVDDAQVQASASTFC
jgi:hypothetical protein